MKLNRSYLPAIIIVVLLAIGVRFFWFTGVFHTSKANEPNRQALLEIREALQLGNSPGEVLAAYWRHRTDALKLAAENGAHWTIRTPLEFGAGNWVLMIEFSQDKVSAVKIRTADGPAPSQGPADKPKPEV